MDTIKIGLEKSFFLAVFSITVLISMHYFTNNSMF